MSRHLPGLSGSSPPSTLLPLPFARAWGPPAKRSPGSVSSRPVSAGAASLGRRGGSVAGGGDFPGRPVGSEHGTERGSADGSYYADHHGARGRGEHGGA